MFNCYYEEYGGDHQQHGNDSDASNGGDFGKWAEVIEGILIYPIIGNHYKE
jgi:hypothetical protein